MSIRIVDVAPGWAREQAATLRPSTLSRYCYSLISLVRSGIRLVDEIERESVRRWIGEQLRAGIKPATCNRNLAAVCSLATWLESRGEFPTTRLLALRQLAIGAPPPPSPRFLTRAEFNRLREAARPFRPELDLALLVAVHAGLRLGELRSLRVEDLVLDVPHPYVRVRRTLGREIKTFRERTAAVSVAFAEEVRGLRLPPGPVFPSGGRGSSSPYLVTPTFERWLAHARAEAGIEDDVTWRTCRHTYASWLVQAGVSIAKVAHWMGHGVAVCFRHYAGLVPGGDPDVERGFVVPPAAP